MDPPLGIKAVTTMGHRCVCTETRRNNTYKWYTLLFTFLIYCSYHLSRKPISVVKSVLNPDNCSLLIHPGISPNHSSFTAGVGNATIYCGWKPFDRPGGNGLLGSLDIAFLFPYAIGMFISGHIAERVSLRYFLSAGMLLSGLSTAMFGLAFYWNIHSISFFLAMQIIGGFVQSTGWPSVVTCVANWFGKGKRGLIMGIWNSHTSFGNILGSLIAGAFAEDNWGLSFIVPGAIISGLAIVVFFFLIPHPEDIGCEAPDQTAAERCGRLDVDEDHENQENGNIQGDSERLTNEGVPLIATVSGTPANAEAISFLAALHIPGVIEFSLSLFFAKLVSYVFLFWLPDYIYNTTNFDAELSADLSTVFDFGGIIGGIIAGVVSDVWIGRATTCTIMLLVAAPLLFVYQTFGNINVTISIVLLFICGFFVNGPYSLITTAVSADLGTHKSLHGNAKALATVTAIIDGTGSLGAAVGPLLAGLFSTTSWNNVFYMLIAADVVAMLFLIRLVKKEMAPVFRGVCRRARNP